MSMERHQRIAQLWSWLPAFRAVAEYQSVQAAAEVLSLSASALSRSVRLLEDAVGEPLFTRRPTGMQLTARGQALLDATRDAMRRIDDSTSAVAAESLALAAEGPFLPSLLAGVAARATLPSLSRIGAIDSKDAQGALLRGEFDLVLLHVHPAGPGLEVEELPALRFVLAGAPGADRARVIGLEGTEVAAEITTATLDAAAVTARSLNGCVAVPGCAVPEGLSILEHLSFSRPVFAVVRSAVSGAPSPHLERVVAEARCALAAAQGTWV